jgi:predicted flap endonuclease-1-like 5' DNA nuclease
VDPAQVAAVEAEFEAAKVAAVPPAVTDVPPAVAAAAASAPAPAPAPAAVAAGVPDVTYATVSSKLNGALQIGKVTPQQMAEMLGGHGVTHMPELAGNLPALAQVDAQLDVILNA